MKSSGGRGNSRKHSGTSKSTRKHSPVVTKTTTVRVGNRTVTTTVKMPVHAKRRGLAVGDAWECCAAEAVAASLRLAGHRVSQDDVLELHLAAGGREDAGVSILAALEAASEFGLAGFRPVFAEYPDARPATDGGQRFGDALVLEAPKFGLDVLDGLPEPHGHVAGRRRGTGLALQHVEDHVANGHSLILGLELPGPHAVTSDGARWWTWGEARAPSDFPRAVVEEAWAVAW